MMEKYIAMPVDKIRTIDGGHNSEKSNKIHF